MISAINVKTKTADATAPFWETGNRLARGKKLLCYRIINKIGQGGMSVVYRGIDEHSGKSVAIKVLHPFLAQDAECRERLLREAATAAQLQHPNIIQIYDHYSHADDDAGGEIFFIVSELIEGLTLKEFAKVHHLHHFPEIGALIIWRLALAIQYAHDHQVVHRDLKPENIMVSSNGVIKLMDFGIARAGEQSSLTATGALLGSPAHMSPELIRGLPTDNRSDIFSLTTIFYWLISGKLPFDSPTPHAVLKAIVDGNFTPPQQVSERIINSTAKVITKGLATEPNQRYQQARCLADDLATSLGELGLQVQECELEALLSQPGQWENWTLRLRGQQLARARLRLKGPHTALAYQLLNRVLADDPDNYEVRDLLASYSAPPCAQWTFSRTALLAVALIFLPLHDFMAPSLTLPPRAVMPTALGQAVEPRAPVMNTAPATARPQPAASPEVKTYSLALSVAPYADIYVDGKLAAKESKKLQLQLSKGLHSLSFRHRFAVTQTIKVQIPYRENLPLHVNLEEIKPAMLIIHSNIDADIAVNAVYKGTTSATAERPVLIAMPAKTYAQIYQVVLKKNGYAPIIKMLEFIAGETLSLTVTFLEAV